jgi:chromosome partitioning protein
MVPSGGQMRAAEARLAQAHGGRGPLPNAFARLSDRYDFILVDCPPSLGSLTTSALLACESVIIPMQCEFFALEGLVQAVAAVDVLRRGRSPDLHVEGILFTMFETAASIGYEVIEDVKNHFGEVVYRSIIPRDTAVTEAPSHGLSIFDYDLRSRAAWAYLRLVKEVLDGG